jgi:hypothetical protein
MWQGHPSNMQRRENDNISHQSDLRGKTVTNKWIIIKKEVRRQATSNVVPRKEFMQMMVILN